MSIKILLTGAPGCGKTTLIQKVLSQIPESASGFYTREIRQHGFRTGFEIVTLDGKRGILSHVDFQGQKRVGKYVVDTNTLEALVIPAIFRGIGSHGLLIIDEIGPMELLSSRFQAAVIDALNSDVSILGTIVNRSTPFTDGIKSRPDVTIIKVNAQNRNTLVSELLARLRDTSITTQE